MAKHPRKYVDQILFTELINKLIFRGAPQEGPEGETAHQYRISNVFKVFDYVSIFKKKQREVSGLQKLTEK